MRSALLALALFLVPLALALPGACADPCTITSDGTFGYGAPVTILASGSSVVWTTSDYTHLTADGRGILDADPCFYAISNPGEPSAAVRFDLADGALIATSEGSSVTCATAEVTPAGATMPYYCALHPTMRGVLVVTA